MSFDSIPEHLLYPESDGEPLGETGMHVRETLALMAMLQWHFREEENVHVGADNFLYYEEGNPRAVVSPDVYVVRGVPKGERRTFKLWEEKAAPCFVMEVSSRSTWLEDHGNKRVIYEKLGVEDYLLFDPEGESIHPPLKAYRRSADGALHEVSPKAEGVFVVASLGVEIWADDSARLRVRGIESGAMALRFDEMAELTDRVDALAGERDALAGERDALAGERDALADERDAVARERDELAARVAALEAKLKG